jgi:hypothetical protein
MPAAARVSLFITCLVDQFFPEWEFPWWKCWSGVLE